jgi:hypothetical protein
MSVLEQHRQFKREMGDKRICDLCGLVNSDGQWRPGCQGCIDDVTDFTRFIKGQVRARGLLGLSDRVVTRYKAKIEELRGVAARIAA